MLSQVFIVKQTVIVQLNVEDFSFPRFGHDLAVEIQRKRCKQVIFDMSSSKTLSSLELSQLEQVIENLRLNGIKARVCGIHPISAALLVHFKYDFNNIEFSLHVDAALDAFASR